MSFTTYAGTELREVHRAKNDTLQAIIYGLPGYAETLDALARCEAVAPVEPGDVTTPEDAAARIVAALEAGEPVPMAEVAEDLGRAALVAQAGEQAADALATARRTLAGRLDDAVRGNAATLWRELNARMVETVAAARHLVTAPATPDEIAAAPDDYRAAKALQGQYAELRDAQEKLTRLLGGVVISGRTAPTDAVKLGEFGTKRGGHIKVSQTSNSDLAAFAYLSNPLEVRPAWPDSWPESWHAPAALWWFRTHPQAKAWVPSPAQFTKAREAAKAQGARQLNIEGEPARAILRPTAVER